MSELTARFDLPLSLEAPSAARHAVRSVLHAWGFRDKEWLHDAMVVVGELVANAVRHGGGSVSVDLQAHEGHVTIGAADGSSVVPRRRDADDEGGRGLAIVEALVTRWDVHDHHGGKRVCVQLPRYSSPVAGRRSRQP